MRNPAISGLLMVLLGSTADAFADEIVAVVDLKFLKETDKTAAVLCLGDSEDDCVVWATHYLWEARVRRVISGTERDAKVLVLYGRHALPKDPLRNAVVVMNKLESTLPSDARYQIVAFGSERNLVCFKRAIGAAPLKVNEKSDDSLSCFDAAPPNKSLERTRAK
jgi:hypothetical protein